MKTYLLFFLVLFLPRLYAQDTIYSEALYQLGTGIEARVAAPGAGNGCTIVGKTTDGRGLYTALDSAGTIRWSVFSTGGEMVLYDLVRTSDQQYLAAGSVYDNAASQTNAWCVKFNELGDTLWTRGITSAQQTSTDIRSVTETFDGNFLFAGSDANTDLTVFQLDPAGNLMWSNTLSGSTLLVESVEQAPDSSFYLIGRDNTLPVYAGFVMHLLSDGSPDWAKSYAGLAFNGGVIREDGLFVAAHLPSAGEPAMVRLDTSGVPQWAKLYNFGEFNETTPLHPEPLSDTTFALLFGNIYSGYMAVIDTAGALLQSYQPQANTVAMTATDDNGWVLVGNGPLYGIKVLDDYHIGVIKTDSLLNASDCLQPGWNGSTTDVTLTTSALSLTSALNDRQLVQVPVTWEQTDVLTTPGCVRQLGGLGENELHALSVSPNPSAGVFRFEQETSQPFVLVVTDATGRELLRSKIQGASAIVDLSGSLPGVCFYCAQFADGTRTSGKLMLVR